MTSLHDRDARANAPCCIHASQHPRPVPPHPGMVLYSAARQRLVQSRQMDLVKVGHWAQRSKVKVILTPRNLQQFGAEISVAMLSDLIHISGQRAPNASLSSTSLTPEGASRRAISVLGGNHPSRGHETCPCRGASNARLIWERSSANTHTQHRLLTQVRHVCRLFYVRSLRKLAFRSATATAAELRLCQVATNQPRHPASVSRRAG